MGLDTRRSELTSQPGTLEVLQNAHINQGGEIEKRKAFVATTLPEQTYGLQSITNSIVIFGSRSMTGWTSTYYYIGNGIGNKVLVITGPTGTDISPSAGQWVNISGSSNPIVNGLWQISDIASNGNIEIWNPIFNFVQVFNETLTILPVVPTGYTYQQLISPTGANMTGVIVSTFYQGKTFAITTWDNGNTLIFYGSTLLQDTYVGVNSNLESSPYDMAVDICKQIVASGQYTVIFPQVVPLFIQVNGGTTGSYLASEYNFGRAVTLSTPGGYTEGNSFLVLNATIPYNISNNQTATDIATAINTNPYGYGFQATAVANKVTIFPPAVDYYGNALPVNGKDSLTFLYNIGDITLFVEPQQAIFDVLSIPTTASAKPFVPTVVTENATLASQLITTGVAAQAGNNAVGQFTIVGGDSNTLAIGSITSSGINPVANQTITFTLGTVSYIYTFVSVLSGATYEVLIGSSSANTMAHLVAAINAATGSGTLYGYETPVNPIVTASLASGTLINLTAINAGTLGNNIVITKTVTTFTVVQLVNGGPDTNQITQITVAGISLLSTYVGFNQSTTITAANVVAAINSYSGTSGFTATAKDNVITLTSVIAGASFNNATLVVTTAGNVCTASCSFIVTGATGQSITGIAVGTVANLLSSAVTFTSGQTSVTYLQAIRDAINANTTGGLTTGYLAWADTTNLALYISKAVNSSLDVISNAIITSAEPLNQYLTSPFTLNFNYSNLAIYWNDATVPKYPSAKESLVITPAGGTPPYTWAVVNSSYYRDNLMTVSFFATTTIGNNLVELVLGTTNDNTTPTGTFQIQCTDFAGLVLTTAPFTWQSYYNKGPYVVYLT